MTEDTKHHQYFCLCCRQTFSDTIPYDKAVQQYMDSFGLRYINHKGWQLRCPHCMSIYYMRGDMEEKIVYTYFLHKHLVDRLHIPKTHIRSYEEVKAICETTKACSKCGRTKYLYEFEINKQRESGFGAMCRECAYKMSKVEVMRNGNK